MPFSKSSSLVFALLLLFFAFLVLCDDDVVESEGSSRSVEKEKDPHSILNGISDLLQLGIDGLRDLPEDYQHWIAESSREALYIMKDIHPDSAEDEEATGFFSKLWKQSKHVLFVAGVKAGWALGETIHSHDGELSTCIYSVSGSLASASWLGVIVSAPVSGGASLLALGGASVTSVYAWNLGKVICHEIYEPFAEEVLGFETDELMKVLEERFETIPVPVTVEGREMDE